MLLFLKRLQVFTLYGGKKRFIKVVESTLDEAKNKRDLVLSLRDTLSSQRILDSDVNAVLNDAQAKLEDDILGLGLVLENET